jgi:hypothetical protein
LLHYHKAQLTQEPGKFTNQLLGKYTVTQWNNLPESCIQAQPSYLMGVDAIDQPICPEVLGMTKCSIA